MWTECQDINESSPDAGREVHTPPTLSGLEQGQPVLGLASSSSSGSAIPDFLPIFSP